MTTVVVWTTTKPLSVKQTDNYSRVVIHNHSREHYIIVLGYSIMILKLFHSRFILNKTFCSSRFFKCSNLTEIWTSIATYCECCTGTFISTIMESIPIPAREIFERCDVPLDEPCSGSYKTPMFLCMIIIAFLIVTII